MEATAIKKYGAEALGTFVLTLFGCGSAAIAGATLGTLGIAFAFGLSIIAMAFVIGNVSGCSAPRSPCSRRATRVRSPRCGCSSWRRS